MPKDSDHTEIKKLICKEAEALDYTATVEEPFLQEAGLMLHCAGETGRLHARSL